MSVRPTCYKNFCGKKKESRDIYSLIIGGPLKSQLKIIAGEFEKRRERWESSVYLR
jgi:hypothetical protein